MSPWLWLGFLGFILCLLVLDLRVFHREPREERMGEALAWSCLWVGLGLAFNVLVYFFYEHHWLGVGERLGQPLNGGTAALQFFTGYLIEKSLSLDNIFVIGVIFHYFRVPLALQHRVLFWGVLGAIVLRGVMIGAGAALLARFDWVAYVFGALLFLTAAKMAFTSAESIDPGHNALVRAARRLYPVTKGFHGDHFFVLEQGRRAATPLFLALLVIESSDVLFAVDSVPAIFAVTNDVFLIFTSNIFAILGLRSLYFVLASLMERFRYLKPSLVLVLALVGVKLCLRNTVEISTAFSLAVILGILLVGALASALAPEPAPTRTPRESE